MEECAEHSESKNACKFGPAREQVNAIARGAKVGPNVDRIGNQQSPTVCKIQLGECSRMFAAMPFPVVRPQLLKLVAGQEHGRTIH